MRMKLLATVATVALLAGCGGMNQPAPAAPAPAQQQPQAQPQPEVKMPEFTTIETPSGTKKQYKSPPPMIIDTNKQYFATIQTDQGSMRIELFAKDAPKTVNNFVFLAQEKFYDNTVFHRIIKNFMIQGGDPLRAGTGGPGYRFEDELPPKRSYEPGIVAMANSGKNTNGSQFFICNGQNCRNLDQLPNYTQFGKVVSGMDVLEKISNLPVVAGGEQTPSKPVTPPVIKTITIETK